MGRVSEQWGEIVPPVHLSTTFERAADGSYPRGRKYARDESPAYDDAEALINALERGAGQTVLSMRTVSGRDGRTTAGLCADADGFSLHAGARSGPVPPRAVRSR